MLVESRGNKDEDRVCVICYISGESVYYIYKVINTYSFSEHVLCARDLLSTVLYSILTSALRWYNYDPHFTAGETVALKNVCMHPSLKVEWSWQALCASLPMTRRRWGEENLMGDISVFILC